MARLTLSLRSKLVLLMLIVQVSMLSLLVCNSVLEMQTSLRAQAELRMQQLAASLHSALIAALERDDTVALQQLVDESWAVGELARLVVYSRTGEQLASSEALVKTRPEAQPDFLTEHIPLELAGLRYGYLEVSVPDQFLREAQAALLTRSLLIASLAIVLSTLLLSLAMRWLMRHLDALRATSAAWARGEFWKQAPVKSQDEIGRLAAELNSMATALYERIEALQQAEEEFRAIADYTFSWESWIDANGRVRWINPSIERISGYSVAEGLALQDYPCELLHPDDAPQAERIRERMLREEPGDGEELRLISKRGEIRWVRVDWQPIRSGSGRKLGIRTSIVDVTARRAAEQALRQSEARFAMAAHVAKLGHWEWSPTDNRLDCSAEIYRIFGLNPQSGQLTHTAALELLLPADRDRVAARIKQALQQDPVFSLEFRALHRDGAIRYVHVQARIQRNSAGQPIRVFGTCQDITERKEAQLALARLNQVYAVLSEINKTVVREQDQAALFRRVCQIMTDIGGLQLAWIGAVDAEMGSVLPVAFSGTASEYVYGLRISMTDEQQRRGPIAQAALSGRLRTHQDIAAASEMAPWQERTARWNLRSIIVAPLRQRSQVVAVLAAYSEEPNFFSPDIIELIEALAADISFAIQAFAEAGRRQRAEAKLVRLNAELEARVVERTRALEAANEELEAFSYSVSHDLRAPLRSIAGFSRQLLDHHTAQLDETGLNYLNRIVRASGRMEQLIADLLRLSQIGRQTLRPRPVALSSLAEAVIDELRQTKPERQVRVEIEQDLTAQADPQLLHIALENLLGNAWKFTAGKAEARIQFGSMRGKDQQIFFIRDNGAGFDRRFVHKLFSPFQRLHSVREFEGTGIGLATVKRIINKHGGRIWAEGEIGAGATFFFTLTRHANSETSATLA